MLNMDATGTEKKYESFSCPDFEMTNLSLLDKGLKFQGDDFSVSLTKVKDEWQFKIDLKQDGFFDFTFKEQDSLTWA